MFNEAKKYFELNGNLKVPPAYKTSNGYDLNIWLNNLKRRQNHLSDEQVTALNDIGMKWRNTSQIRA